MTKQDATQFLMGFIMGASLNEKLTVRKKRDGGIERKALQKGLNLLADKNAGFFHALERVVREEIEMCGFRGEYN